MRIARVLTGSYWQARCWWLGVANTMVTEVASRRFATNSRQWQKERSGEWRNYAGFKGMGFCGANQFFRGYSGNQDISY
jgi:hypothetical protein